MFQPRVYHNFDRSRVNSTVVGLLETPNGDLLSASRDGSIKIWNVSRGELRQSINSARKGLSCVELLYNGNLAFGHDNGEIHICTLNPLAKIKSLCAESGREIRRLTSISTQLLASCHKYKPATIWNLDNGQALFTIEDANYVLACPNEQLAVQHIQETERVQIYEANTGEVLKTLECGRKANIIGLVLLSNVNIAAYDRIKNEIIIWDLPSCQIV
jgi:WD40 repeat protein